MLVGENPKKLTTFGRNCFYFQNTSALHPLSTGEGKMCKKQDEII
jgi:hypothetical protein